LIIKAQTLNSKLWQAAVPKETLHELMSAGARW